jgi:hypothetical protein
MGMISTGTISRCSARSPFVAAVMSGLSATETPIIELDAQVGILPL